jgi:serine/threonine protein kinase
MSQRDAVIAGRYRLVNRIGVGGMGSVWEAWDERLHRTVALKLLHTRPGMSEAEAQVAKDRAMREARITARLQHPRAVPVFDVVEHDGQPCLVMQYLPSRTLQQVLAEKGTLPPEEVALVGAEVAAALAAAHQAGIVHRDVKPANVLITEDGSAKITDFGISRALGDASLTSTGMVTGTPAFFAPEVARGGESTFASDVFSLGATLYAALEGAPPFGSDDNAMALLHRVASGAINPPTRAAGLAPVLLGMLADRPEDRPTMTEAASALERLDLAAVGATAPLPEVPPAGSDRASAAAPARPSSTETAILAPVASDPPESSDPPQPPASPAPTGADEEPRRSRTALLLVGLVLALVVATVLAVQGLRGEPSAAPPGVGPTTSAPAPSASSTSSPPTTTAPEPTTSPPAPPASSPSSSSASPSTTEPAAPTAQDLAQAVTDYYALLPRDTKSGYALLTDRFRRDKAGSFESYDAFWGKLDRITTSDAVGTPPGTVEATVTYRFDDGRVIVERTAYQLVEDGGVLKIDRTAVLKRLSP